MSYLDSLTLGMGDGEMVDILTEWCISNADSVVSAWWDFSEFLIVKYDEGFVNSPGHLVQGVGYPHRWLVTTEWVDGPIEYGHERSGE